MSREKALFSFEDRPCPRGGAGIHARGKGRIMRRRPGVPDARFSRRGGGPLSQRMNQFSGKLRKDGLTGAASRSLSGGPAFGSPRRLKVPHSQKRTSGQE